MKATNPWITYRTRFLVKAKQLTTSLAFTDVLGRQHSGRKGDYLVESSDGVLRIVSRQIFEDIYVHLPASEIPGQRETPADRFPPVSPDPQISPTLPRPPQPGCSLSVNPSPSRRVRKGLTGHWPLITGHCSLCECSMNFPLWKTNPSTPARDGTKPVIVEDTTYGVSLLTGTISGSNFAFP